MAQPRLAEPEVLDAAAGDALDGPPDAAADAPGADVFDNLSGDGFEAPPAAEAVRLRLDFLGSDSFRLLIGCGRLTAQQCNLARVAPPRYSLS